MIGAWCTFDNREAAAQALARLIADEVLTCLSHRAQAVIVVPGGKTPMLFLEILSRQALPWSRIVFALTDERCVGMEDERRNERMVRQTMLSPFQLGARLSPLVSPEGIPLSEPLPMADCLILGMGDDGHVASLFGPQNPEAIGAVTVNRRPLVVSNAPDGLIRVTRGFADLTSPTGTHLLCFGTSKAALLRTLDADTANGEKWPVACLVQKPTIWYAP